MTSSYTWREFTFSNVKNIDPNDRLCLVFKSDDDLACFGRYDNQTSAGYLRTSDSGSHWTIDTGKAMVYYVYGTYTTPPPELRSVTMVISPDDDPSAQARASVVTLARPLMP